MIAEQTKTPPHEAVASKSGRAVKAGAAAIVSLMGLAALVWPLVRPIDIWRLSLASPPSFSTAQINADIVRNNESGVILTRQGSRPISVISPPLSLPPYSSPVLDVAVAIPSLKSPEINTHVRFLWQTEDVPAYRHFDTTATLSHEMRTIRIALPIPASEMHRMGVQFPDITDDVLVESMALPYLSVNERLQLLGAQFFSREPIAVHSINFLRGPRILAHGLNYYLITAALFLGGLLLTIRLVQRRRCNLGLVCTVLVGLWFVADVQTTWNLARQVREEVPAFKDLSTFDKIALADGPEIAWAYEKMLANTPPGATFVVLGDDSFTPSHRLGYWLAPQRIRTESTNDAEYLVVVHDSATHFDDTTGELKSGEKALLAAEKIAILSPEVYIIRAVRRP